MMDDEKAIRSLVKCALLDRRARPHIGLRNSTLSPTMYRLLFITGLLILLYFLIRSAIRELTGKKGTGGGALMEDPNKMVQDPVCKIFVPKGTAVMAEIGGQTYFFCSRDCALTFQKQLSS